jgi:hypothetical protein
VEHSNICWEWTCIPGIYALIILIFGGLPFLVWWHVSVLMVAQGG